MLSADPRRASRSALAVAVLGGEGDGFEIARFREAAHIVRRVFRQLRHGDHRQALAHPRPLDRIVVDEHQAIDADVEPRRDGFQVLRLVVPIGLEGGEIRAAENHFGMIAKRRFGDLGVVLGADGQNDAPLLELLGVMLQGEMRFARGAALPKNDAVQAVVTDHAAP
jgi:hypothetical protein